MDLFKNIFTFKNIGTRTIQEDDFLIFDFEDIEKTRFNVVFIFDGHGAKNKDESLPEVIIRENILINEIKRFFHKRKMSITNLTSFFPYFESYLDNKVKKYVGTCLSAVFMSPLYFFTLTLGDTSIRIFDSSNKLYFQTPLHNFKNKSEMERYITFKQDVFIKDGRYRGLLMSRTLGDYDCKTLGERCLIPIPEIKRFYNNRPFIFLLKSDGMTISSKILINKYNDCTIDKFLKEKNFANNASLVIFSSTHGLQKTDIDDVEENKNKNNVILLSFLKYVYE
ncbi:hypothetical protein Yalta_153 [Yalta virus]|nr:hypothetical protein Yalta_153 [Yalta virus]